MLNHLITSIYKNKLISYLKRHQLKVYVIGLIFLSIMTHVAWFSFDTTLFQNDWLHRPTETLPQAWEMAQTWKNFINFGGPNIQIGYFIVSVLWPFIGNFGGSFDTAVKITMMIPIALLGFLSPFFTIRYILKNNFISFCAAIFYGSTTYFLLSQTVQLPIAFIYAICPLIFFYFIRAVDTKKTKDWIWFSLIFTIGLCYEVRIMYLVMFILSLFIIFNLTTFLNKSLIKQLAKSGLIILLLNSFWILPTVFGGIGSSVSEQTSTDLFGSWLFDLPHAISLSASGWTGGATSGKFILEPIQLYLWIIPLIALLSVFIKSNAVSKKYVLFFFAIALIGIFLTKQAEQPLTGAYLWLYNNFPGFSLFREASKFYLLTAFGYMGLISFTLLFIKNIDKKLMTIPASAILIISFVNLTPLFTSEIGGVFKSRTEPASYAAFSKKIREDKDDFRTLWIPTYSQWTYFDTSHPRASISTLLSQDWKSLLPANSGTTQTKIKSFLESSYAKTIIDYSQTKYIAVPARDKVNDDNYFPLFGDDREAYISMLDKLPWLKRIDKESEIAIYENITYRKHFTTTDSLLGVTSQMPLSESYLFNSINLAAKDNDRNFTISKQETDTDSPANTIISDIYQDPYQIKYGNNGLSTSIIPLKGYVNSLYTDINRPNISYSVSENNITFMLNNSQVLSISKPTTNNDKTTVLDSSHINFNKNYKLSIGNKLNDLSLAKNTTHNIGTVTEKIALYEASDTNLIDNGSFEDGLWNKNIENCNNYDENASIGQQLEKNKKIDGRVSLKLIADNHTACTTSKPISINENQEYALNYSYSVKHGQKAGYDLIFNDPKNTIISEDQIEQSGYWKKLNIKFTAPKNASQVLLRLKGYSDASRRSTADTYYDQVKVTSLQKVMNVTSDEYTQSFNTSNLDDSKVITPSIKDPEFKYSNIIKNPSLENGLWQKEVGDCNAYDNSPKLSMLLSSQSTDGRQSLELGASRHIACTGPGTIDVKEGGVYLFKFDFKVKAEESAGYYIGFNDQNSSNIFEKVESKNGDWQTFSKVVQVPYGASKLSFNVYGFSKEDGNIKSVINYDNFKMIQIPDVDNRFYLVSKSKKIYSNPKRITYNIQDPTHKTILVSAAKDNFYLYMSEKFNKNWTLSAASNQMVNGFNANIPYKNDQNSKTYAKHFEANGFMNGWSINTALFCKQNSKSCVANSDGSFDIKLKIEYSPQRWFNVGLGIGLLTLVAITLYLVNQKINRKSRAKKTSN